jgi:hypothetical protein
MATQNRVLSDLRREMSSQIQKIVPNRKIDPGADWTEHNPEDGENIRSISAPARVFQIGDFVPNGTFAIGGSTRNQVGDIEVVFAYPSSEKWSCAAQDDMIQIDNFLLGNPSTVTGVAGRWVNTEKPLRIEQSQEDARKFYVLTVMCHLETTF